MSGALCKGSTHSGPLGLSRSCAPATGPEPSSCRHPLAPTDLSSRACRTSRRNSDCATEISEASVEDPPPVLDIASDLQPCSLLHVHVLVLGTTTCRLPSFPFGTTRAELRPLVVL